MKTVRVLLSPVLRRLPAYSRLAWNLARDRRLRRAHRVLVLGGVAYVLSPIDLVPGIIPVLGQMDDLAVALLSLRAVLRRIPAPLVEEHLQAAGLTLDALDEDIRALGVSGRLLSRTALRLGWRAAHWSGRTAAALGRRLLRRRAG